MKDNTLPAPLIIFLPLLVLLSSILIAKYFPLDSSLSIGITADLVFTFPLLYLVLIWNRKIPKTTAIPVLFIGVVVGNYILPDDQQVYLNAIKWYVLPIVELAVLIYILYGIYKVSQAYKASDAADFYTKLLYVSQQLFPKKVSYFIASELSIPYYCFFCWQAPILKQNQFFYHKKSGSIALLWALIMILIVETIALHFIVGLWSTTAAWVLTILSIYTCFQVLSLIKSMPQRPFEVKETVLWLAYGTLCEAKIPLEQIEQVLDYDRTQDTTNAVRFSPLGELETPNLWLKFKHPIKITTTFGKQKECSDLLLFVDDKEGFQQYLANSLI